MSFASEEEVDCSCGETFTARLWNSVNFRQDPELKSMLLGGALNVVTCSLCKNLVFVDRFVLVHDQDNEILAFVHPKAREPERAALTAAMEQDMIEAQGVEGGMKVSYPPAIFFGMDGLIDLMKTEEEIEDQSAIVEAMAPTLSVNVIALSPSRARAAGLPRRLPLAGGGAPGERLVAGLKILLAANDRLTLYAALLRRAQAGDVPASALVP